MRLPAELLRRFKRAVTPRRCSKYIEQLLDRVLHVDEVNDQDPLYQVAPVVENDVALGAEMAEWEPSTLGDGLPPAPSERMRR